MLHTYICRQCGKKFIGRPDKHCKYCSQECAHAAQDKRVTRRCKICNKPYKVKHHQLETSKYCSRECAAAARRKDIARACEYCGKVFIGRSSVIGRRKYCSMKCFHAMMHSVRVTQTCPICGKQFEVKPSAIKRGHGKYCSRKCGNIGRSREAQKRRKLKQAGIGCICRTCGKKFFRTPSVIAKGGGKYCSMECFRAMQKETIKKVECVCEFCHKVFYRLECQVKQEGYGRFCSQSCRSKYTVRQQHITSPTSIEQAIVDELDKRNVEYEFQYPLNGYIVDFAFPDDQIVAEADGVYWHGLEHVQERDARKDADLAKQGWTILRFTGDEIRQSVSACVNKIVEHLS